MFWERKLELWADKVRTRMSVPLWIDLWNGQQLSLSHELPQVIIRVPHVSALSCLFTSSLSNLGSAYVDGKIEVEGKPSAIIAIGNALASGTLKLEGKFSRIARKFRHSREKDKAAIEYHYNVSDDFYASWLDENLRRHYAKTCEHWVKNFEANAEAIRLQVGDRRYRIWQAYLAGCAYAFNQDWISLYQVVCVKSGRVPSALPWSRRYMYG